MAFMHVCLGLYANLYVLFKVSESLQAVCKSAT